MARNSFHSKMVRLKAYAEVIGAEKIYAFPFQNGSIKSSVIQMLDQLAPIGFHSKMVRLKEVMQWYDSNQNSKFPFQNGSIKS